MTELAEGGSLDILLSKLINGEIKLSIKEMIEIIK